MAAITVDHLLNQVRAFVDEQVAPAAANWSMGAEPDPALFAKAGALNLMGIEVPTDLGGLGLGFAVKTQVCEIIAAADFGIAMAIWQFHFESQLSVLFLLFFLFLFSCVCFFLIVFSCFCFC